MLINRKGIAVAVVAVVLTAAGIWYAVGPSYLSNPVVSASVKQCKGRGAERFCVGTWQGGHGGIEAVPDSAGAGDRVPVKAKDGSSATAKLALTTFDWIVRELVSAILLAVAAVLVVYLVRRRRRYVTENPDDLAKLDQRS